MFRTCGSPRVSRLHHLQVCGCCLCRSRRQLYIRVLTAPLCFCCGALRTLQGQRCGLLTAASALRLPSLLPQRHPQRCQVRWPVQLADSSTTSLSHDRRMLPIAHFLSQSHVLRKPLCGPFVKGVDPVGE